MNNILSNIGDILIVKISPEIDGKVVFTNYVENIIGETDQRKLKREFRISSDEIFWTEWEELTSENLSKETYISESNLLVQIRYTRIGSDESGDIVFNEIKLLGNREEVSFDAPTLSSSIFSPLLNKESLRKLERNIFKKLYFRGVVPEYITRRENFNKKEDEDYTSLFFSISRFFSMFICYFKRFENFKNDFDLMKEQVRQYGIFFDESTVTLEELQYLMSNMFDQIRQRGTEMIFKQRGFELSNGELLKIDGEFLRLLRIKENDELLYELIPSNKIGWCMRNSSPMYKGTSNSRDLNKVKGEDFQTAQETLYHIDTSLDYEVTFEVVVKSGNPSMEFSVKGFDLLKDEMNDSFITSDGDVVIEHFLNKETINFKHNQKYFIRGIIKAYSSRSVDNDKLNIGYGNNLKFNNSFTQYLSPNIRLSSSNSFTAELENLSIRPLVRGKNITPLIGKDKADSQSLGFIQCPRIFYCYARNNNNSQSVKDIRDLIQKYLMPFNSTDLFIFTGNY